MVNILLSLYYDGAQVFDTKSQNFWPLMISILNLPPPLRKTRGKGLFTISIYTATSKSNTEKFIFDNLVDELLMLQDGIEVTINNTKYFLQARLVMQCYDSRALESMLCTQGGGSYAGCPLCRLAPG
jgi:hypothetical protein